MHPLYDKANKVSRIVLDAAIEVQKHFRTGLMESIYVKALGQELTLRGCSCKREVPVTIDYKGFVFDERLRIDLLVDECFVVEAKAHVKSLDDMKRCKAQTLSYLKLMNLPLGAVVDFGNDRLGERGFSRVILKGADA